MTPWPFRPFSSLNHHIEPASRSSDAEARASRSFLHPSCLLRVFTMSTVWVFLRDTLPGQIDFQKTQLLRVHMFRGHRILITRQKALNPYTPPTHLHLQTREYSTTMAYACNSQIKSRTEDVLKRCYFPSASVAKAPKRKRMRVCVLQNPPPPPIACGWSEC